MSRATTRTSLSRSRKTWANIALLLNATRGMMTQDVEKTEVPIAFVFSGFASKVDLVKSKNSEIQRDVWSDNDVPEDQNMLGAIQVKSNLAGKDPGVTGDTMWNRRQHVLLWQRWLMVSGLH